MNRYLKYSLYIFIPLVVYYIILIIAANLSFTIGGCNEYGLLFNYYKFCTGPLGASTESWNILNLILELVVVYALTGVVYYYLEKRSKSE